MRVKGRLRRAMASLAAVTALTLLASGCTADPEAQAEMPSQVTGDLPGDTVDALRAAVDHAIAATGSTGAIVGVWAPWAGAWVTGIGTTGVDTDKPVTADMSFRATTMTRPMICDALYGLVADGVVALDDPISAWVPSSPDLTDVTLRQVCDGTAGLAPARAGLELSILRTPERVWNPREIAAAGLGRPGAEPGVAFSDSDTGYILLGLALQNASGETPAALIQKYATGPLGLGDTFLPGAAAAPTDLPGYRSSSDDLDKGCVKPADYTTLSATVGSTDAGVISTIRELGVYAEALAGRVKDDAGDTDERWSDPTPVDPDADSWYQYAGGTYIAGSLVGQQGALPGYLTSAYSDIDNGLTVAVVLNNSRAGGEVAGDLAKELAAIVSKTPARAGEKAPESGLPWTADDFHQRIADAAVCPVDADE